PQRLETPVYDGADVARVAAVLADRIPDRVHQLVIAVGNGEPCDLAGVEHALHVAVEAKYRRAAGCGVRPDPFEHARAVVHHVGEDVDLCVLERHELPIHPDQAARFTRHAFLLSAWIMVRSSVARPRAARPIPGSPESIPEGGSGSG